MAGVQAGMPVFGGGRAFTGCQTMPSGRSSAKPPAEQTHSETIVLREGDVLKITFPGSPNLDTAQPIRRDGKLNLPLIGEVDGGGHDAG